MFFCLSEIPHLINICFLLIVIVKKNQVALKLYHFGVVKDSTVCYILIIKMKSDVSTKKCKRK